MSESPDTLVWQRCNWRIIACKHIAPIGAKHWLRAPSRSYEGETIVRCPWHFTDHALLESCGRLSMMRHLSREAREWGRLHEDLHFPVVLPDMTNTTPSYVRSWMRIWE